MAIGQRGKRPYGIARFTLEAEDDRLLAYLATNQIWGARQAQTYDDFLAGIIQNLADQPGIGSIVENTTGIRRYFARWKKARRGHHIFYEQTKDGILVLRILHSTMNRPDLLG